MDNLDTELILDPEKLPRPETLPDPSVLPNEGAPRVLPKHLLDFKQYVDSKFCYNSGPLERAELISVEHKFAYQGQMNILMEARFVDWKEEPHPWANSKVLFSSTLGRYLDDTTRGGQPIGDIWNDYPFNLPSTDERVKEKLSLPHCTYLSRCDKCGGKRTKSCGGCSSGRADCTTCGGSGKVACSSCKGCGGFQHLATLKISWHTRKSTWTSQNSFLPNKNIDKATRTPFWNCSFAPWSKQSAIEMFAQPLGGEAQLQASMIQEYREKHLEPTLTLENAMRRLVCTIERLNFEEISYSLDEKYVNKKDPARSNTFRFCQYSADGKGELIYENDYPLNSCGCLGEKHACYSSCCCCSIL